MAAPRSTNGRPTSTKLSWTSTPAAAIVAAGQRRPLRASQAAAKAGAIGDRLVILAGPQMAHAHRVLLAAGLPPSSVIHVPDTDDATIGRIATAIHPGDLVLLKGSRRMRLERVLEALRNRTFPRPLTAAPVSEPKPVPAFAG